MRYYLDCEFNGYRGQLMSLALVPETDDPGFIWIEQNIRGELNPWVAEHVFPVLASVPDGRLLRWSTDMTCGDAVLGLLTGDPGPTVVTASQTDMNQFQKAILGMDLPKAGIDCFVELVDAYPTQREGAVRHNAWWDAMALREVLRCRA